SSNFGSIQLLAAANNPSYQLQSFIKFDLGGVAGAQVAHATLRIYGALVSGGANAATGVFAVSNTSWSETATTWTTMPALGVQIGSTTVGDATPRWYEIDLTGYVRDQLAAGASSITVGLKGVAPSPAVPMFGSRESVVGPQLVIASGS